MFEQNSVKQKNFRIVKRVLGKKINFPVFSKLSYILKFDKLFYSKVNLNLNFGKILYQNLKLTILDIQL